MDPKNVAVIGAGIGGLSAAIHLALAGFRVQVFEQNPQVGGKMGEIRAAGFRWDTGPSVITMRHVFADLFRKAGRRLEDYLTLLPVEPLTRYFYPDGVVFDASRDLPRMLAQITALDERDAAGYLAFLAYAAEIHRVSGPVFIYDRPPAPGSFLKVPPRDYLKIDPFRKMQPAIRSFIRSPHLRQLLGRFATYVGASPYLAPATLNVIAHVELNGGVWYPQGGVYTIARGLAQLAQELGVEIHTGCPVERVEVKAGKAVGIVPAGGTFQPADAVVANVDVATAYRRLLPEGSVPEKRVRRWTRAEPSGSGFVLLLGVEGESRQLAHHNIFFSSDYRREFEDIFTRHLPPDEPTIYLATTSKTDRDHAPPGCENWFVLVNAPPAGPEFDWTTQAVAYRERILARLVEFGLDVRDRILYEQFLTPLDLAERTGAWRGALYGQSSNARLAAFRRPHNRCPDVAGLYFAGGTTHPGGGVPMVALSGKVAAGLIEEDFGPG